MTSESASNDFPSPLELDGDGFYDGRGEVFGARSEARDYAFKQYAEYGVQDYSDADYTELLKLEVGGLRESFRYYRWRAEQWDKDEERLMNRIKALEAEIERLKVQLDWAHDKR